MVLKNNFAPTSGLKGAMKSKFNFLYLFILYVPVDELLCLHLFVYSCVEARGQFPGVGSLFHVSPEGLIQTVRFDRRSLYPLCHLPGLSCKYWLPIEIRMTSDGRKPPTYCLMENPFYICFWNVQLFGFCMLACHRGSVILH